ncbi:hypothetical protein AYJ54_07880 [Bradyrhizobium centrolobii]|uniref:Uncharacterized protein n=1 Tax=Bradyrhizobium centrolobii TaxID=1505087 RepID=A0A176YVN3_9BRAD|nr:hypothetical protein [Bradyrhizobium centrolobii]OAF11770.1 hypothetical protein AYJ54_07880 [Bradyrhizobium centrolobii]
MSRFDELTKLFDPWRNQWVDQSREHQLLAPRIAKRFQEYLGCPEFFNEGHPSGGKQRYVSATRAIWNEQKRFFSLEAHDEAFPELDYHEDGFLYFGLRVFLEHAPNTYPKQPFWFLLRCKFDGSRFVVTVQRSKQDFDVGFAPLKLEELCGHLFDLLKDELSKNPMVNDRSHGNRIGFV